MFQRATFTPFYRITKRQHERNLRLRAPDPKTTGGEVVYSREHQKELREEGIRSKKLVGENGFAPQTRLVSSLFQGHYSELNTRKDWDAKLNLIWRTRQLRSSPRFSAWLMSAWKGKVRMFGIRRLSMGSRSTGSGGIRAETAPWKHQKEGIRSRRRSVRESHDPG